MPVPGHPGRKPNGLGPRRIPERAAARKATYNIFLSEGGNYQVFYDANGDLVQRKGRLKAMAKPKVAKAKVKAPAKAKPSKTKPNPKKDGLETLPKSPGWPPELYGLPARCPRRSLPERPHDLQSSGSPHTSLHGRKERLKQSPFCERALFVDRDGSSDGGGQRSRQEWARNQELAG